MQWIFIVPFANLTPRLFIVVPFAYTWNLDAGTYVRVTERII